MNLKISDLLTPAQLADLLNWISMGKEIRPVEVNVVVSWTVKQRRSIEAWCDHQMRLLKILPEPVRKRHEAGEKFPPELERFGVFRAEWWARAQRWHEKTA